MSAIVHYYGLKATIINLEMHAKKLNKILRQDLIYLIKLEESQCANIWLKESWTLSINAHTASLSLEISLQHRAANFGI